MKVLILVAIFGALCVVNGDHAADCKDQVTAFDCGGRGSPFYIKDSEGYCSFNCKSGDVILTCEQVHPAPDTAGYKNAECSGSPAYNCEGTGTRGYPHWSYCKFDCMVGGDMLFTCPQIWRA